MSTDLESIGESNPPLFHEFPSSAMVGSCRANAN
jgi:hypothetical protein